jgi:hypothetical protein
MTSLLRAAWGECWPACAAFAVECAAWWLAARRYRGIIAGAATGRYVLAEVALSYGVLGSWSSCDTGAARWAVVGAALAGAWLGWWAGNRGARAASLCHKSA